MAALSDSCPPADKDSDAVYHIIPETDVNRNMGVNASAVGFRAYHNRNPNAMINWNFYWKRKYFAVVLETGNTKYYWQAENGEVQIQTTNGSIGSILNDDRNLFERQNAQPPYVFVPKLLPQKVVLYISPRSLTMGLSEHRESEAFFFINLSNVQIDHSTNAKVVGVVAVAMIAVLIGIFAYKQYSNNK